MKRETFFDGKPVLFIDQYGDRFWARSLAELRGQCPGAVTAQYNDRKDGSTVRNGYAIGVGGANERWLTAFKPIEFAA